MSAWYWADLVALVVAAWLVIWLLYSHTRLKFAGATCWVLAMAVATISDVAQGRAFLSAVMGGFLVLAVKDWWVVAKDRFEPELKLARAFSTAVRGKRDDV